MPQEEDSDSIPLPNLRELELEGYGVPCLLLLNSLLIPAHTTITLDDVRWQYPHSGAAILPTILSSTAARCFWEFDLLELRRDGKNYQITCSHRSLDGNEKPYALKLVIPARAHLLCNVCNSLALDSITELILCNLSTLKESEHLEEIASIIGGFHQVRVLWFIKCTVAIIDRLLGELVADGHLFQLDDLSIIEPELRTCPARAAHDSDECANCIIRLKEVIERTLNRQCGMLPYLWIQSKHKMKKKNLRFLLEVADTIEYDCTEHLSCCHVLGRNNDT